MGQVVIAEPNLIVKISKCTGYAIGVHIAAFDKVDAHERTSLCRTKNYFLKR